MEDVNDILQEVFFKIHKHRHNLPHSNRLSSWVFTISRNTLIDYYRKNRVYGELIDFAQEDNQSELVSNDRSFSECFLPFINFLPQEDRELLEKVDIQGQKQKDLAKELNMSYSGLKSRVQRARNKMKDLFQACCEIKLDSAGYPVGCVPKCDST